MSHKILKWVEKKFQLSWKVSWKSFRWVEFQDVKSLPRLNAIKQYFEQLFLLSFGLEHHQVGTVDLLLARLLQSDCFRPSPVSLGLASLLSVGCVENLCKRKRADWLGGASYGQMQSCGFSLDPAILSMCYGRCDPVSTPTQYVANLADLSRCPKSMLDWLEPSWATCSVQHVSSLTYAGKL